MNLNHNYYIEYEKYSQMFFAEKNQPFGAMPRVANSLRIIRLIQVAKVVSPSNFACSSSCWRNSSDNLIWYCGDLFSFCGVDMVFTSMYSYLYGNYHNKKVQKKQTPKSISPLLSVLTNNLTKDKTMANLNYTGSFELMESYTLNLGNLKKSQKFIQKHFTKCGQFLYSFPVVAKSTTEPANSNDETLANSSTPLIRAFFVRSPRIPKERLKKACSSMVACSGKGFALCCVPMFAVLQPVTRYRPQACKLQAVISKNLALEIIKMIYKFLLLGSRLTVRTYAKNEAEARQILNLSHNQAVFIARLKGGCYA